MIEDNPGPPQEAGVRPAESDHDPVPRAPLPGAKPTDGVDQAALIYRSDELLQGRRQVLIEHGSDMYRLRLTASGKLYLTK